MRIVITLISCFFILFSTTSYAQPESIVGERSLSGTVTDHTGIPIQYAAVAIYSLPDSSLVFGSATDNKGRFKASLNPDNYLVTISFLSYNTYRKVIELSSSLNLGTIRLSEKTVLLEEAKVTATKMQMEVKLDKRVFNVASDATLAGASTADILDNLPSVTVDVEGNVTLRGSESVRVLVDGKPSALTGMSGQDALRQLQGDLVEKIEIITNPSARYDAEGESGIINIILKKEKRDGFNGSFTAKVGNPDNYGLSYNINSRRKNVNFFSSLGVGYRKSLGSGNYNQRFSYEDTSFSFKQDRTHERKGLNGNFRLGMDWSIGSKSTLTFSGNISEALGYNEANLNYRDFNSDNVLLRSVLRIEDEEEERGSQEANLDFRKHFGDNKDHKISASARYSFRKDYEVADLSEKYSDDINRVLLQQAVNNEDGNSFVFQSDYEKPLGKDGLFELGVKASRRNIKNEYTVTELDSANVWNELSDFTNDFRFGEDIYAAYAMAGNKFGPLSMQFGLRFESSNILTELLVTEYENERHYNNFFPSANLSYEFKKERFIQLSYSRRINRPGLWHLLPFFSFGDSRSFWSGNPNINPSFVNAFEIGYLAQSKKGSMLASLYYRRSNGIVERISISDSIGFTRKFPINLSNEDAYGLELSGNRELNAWLSTSASFNFFQSTREGEYEGQDFGSETFSWTGRSSFKFKVRRDFSAQTSFQYRAPRVTSQGETEGMFHWSAGAALDVLKGNGTLSLAISDILNSRRRRSTTITPVFVSEGEFQWRQRQATLSFNYRVNQKKKRGGREFSPGDLDMGM